MQKQWKIIYLPSKETMDTEYMEETKWLNVQNVAQKSRSRKKLGKWPDAQTNKANVCNSK